MAPSVFFSNFINGSAASGRASLTPALPVRRRPYGSYGGYGGSMYGGGMYGGGYGGMGYGGGMYGGGMMGRPMGMPGEMQRLSQHEWGVRSGMPWACMLFGKQRTAAASEAALSTFPKFRTGPFDPNDPNGPPAPPSAWQAMLHSIQVRRSRGMRRAARGCTASLQLVV